MKIIIILFGSLCSLASLTVTAGVYKCTDETGKVVYKSQACLAGQSNAQVDIKTGITKDLDQEKQQQLLKDQAEQAKLTEQEQQEQKIAEKQARLKQEAKDESAKNQFLIKNNPLQYSAFAIPPYDPEQLPALVKNFAARLPDIERFRRFAAGKALATNQCGRVESVELNNKSTQDALVFLVDCSTAKKYYLSEQELKPQ
ncbi:DUF4124 domain-containing protein [Methylomicrobium sp. Wu6]|uniref:DUF4124 domain-containing protein n=1 Tax=Methylomicrobium sp. Wu6 TaxID=3107928 RepID=UPI002DD67630|nr:DUF4124 domain-containing protein [Methylomicrobium sp. Wu6]MEC4747607.1 DUF4124 domain-containing protein [Methylomicrobium sp. Wu6]